MCVPRTQVEHATANLGIIDHHQAPQTPERNDQRLHRYRINKIF